MDRLSPALLPLKHPADLGVFRFPFDLLGLRVLGGEMPRALETERRMGTLWRAEHLIKLVGCSFRTSAHMETDEPE
jgi:hypothetical protein